MLTNHTTYLASSLLEGACESSCSLTVIRFNSSKRPVEVGVGYETLPGLQEEGSEVKAYFSFECRGLANVTYEVSTEGFLEGSKLKNEEALLRKSLREFIQKTNIKPFLSFLCRMPEGVGYRLAGEFEGVHEFELKAIFEQSFR